VHEANGTARREAAVRRGPAVSIDRRRFDAAIFDLDGVLTDTARIHAAAWKTVLDAFLERRAGARGEPFVPFSQADYLAHVDGRPRGDGIRAFLAARGIRIAEGSAGASSDDTVRGIGERKTRLFLEALRRGIEAEPGAAALLVGLRRARVRIAVASSSKNCAAILQAAGLDGRIDVRVDGVDAEALALPGKPDPALFLEAARRLGAPPTRIILFEDALAGVEAGRRGGFARVVGIDRAGQGAALRQHGADVVIRDLDEVNVR
jgi:beta-phosphoglucomutase family hydrolase